MALIVSRTCQKERVGWTEKKWFCRPQVRARPPNKLICISRMRGQMIKSIRNPYPKYATFAIFSVGLWKPWRNTWTFLLNAPKATWLACLYLELSMGKPNGKTQLQWVCLAVRQLYKPRDMSMSGRLCQSFSSSAVDSLVENNPIATMQVTKVSHSSTRRCWDS